MNGFFRSVGFTLAAVLLTGGLLYLLQYLYFSDFTRAFDVVCMLLALIIYSNLLALLYRQTQKETL